MQIAGVGLLVAAGAMQGGFPLPLKFIRNWEWENTWIASSLLGLVVFPWWIAAWRMTDLTAILRACPPRALLEVFLFGAGWGVGGLLFGLAVPRVGLSITTGVVIGLTSAIGCVAPLILFHPDRLAQADGAMAVAAVLVTLIGLYFCTRAGSHRESRLERASYWTGILICGISGLLSPLFNFAFIRGDALIATATAHGVPVSDSSNLILAVAMTGGMIPTAIYCLHVLIERGTWRRFFRYNGMRDILLAVGMGILFAVGNALYGMGAERMGDIGPILGWPLFMATQVIIANGLGIATGEWENATAVEIRNLLFGNLALIGAVFIIGRIPL